MLTFYTPTHQPHKLQKAYKAWMLGSQQYPDIKWIILLNGAASRDELPAYITTDSRIEIFDAPNSVGSNIGALKKHAVSIAASNTSAVSFVELDHDDELTIDAFDELYKLADADKFHYSDAAGDTPFDGAYGWDPYTVKFGDLHYWVNSTFECNSRSLCEIFYAPNHVRMWGREAYLKSGGYNANLEVCDDHELLIRTYLADVEMVHIPKPLYIQHESQEQTQVVKNALIQTTQEKLRDQYTEMLVLEEARRRNLLAIDLGAIAPKYGYKTLNTLPADYRCDATKPLPFADNSVMAFRASDFLEHVPTDKVVSVMNELYRCLAPGGWLLTMTPSTDGRGAFQDPTHSSYWNSNSFWYYTKREHQRYVPESRSRFQMVSLKNFQPDDFCKLHNIVYTQANMWALKGQKKIGRVGI